VVAQRIYNPPEGPAYAGWVRFPRPPRFFWLRRAARTSIARAQSDSDKPAPWAASMKDRFSESSSRISIRKPFGPFGSFGGLPIRFSLIPLVYGQNPKKSTEDLLTPVLLSVQ